MTDTSGVLGQANKTCRLIDQSPLMSLAKDWKRTMNAVYERSKTVWMILFIEELHSTNQNKVRSGQIPRNLNKGGVLYLPPFISCRFTHLLDSTSSMIWSIIWSIHHLDSEQTEKWLNHTNYSTNKPTKIVEFKMKLERKHSNEL